MRSEVQVFLGPPITGGLAQLGERLICIQEVSGSIPLSSTKKHLVILFVKIILYYQYLYPIVRIDEQSKLIFIIYNLKKLKVSMVEDSGIEPLTS